MVNWVTRGEGVACTSREDELLSLTFSMQEEFVAL